MWKGGQTMPSAKIVFSKLCAAPKGLQRMKMGAEYMRRMASPSERKTSEKLASIDLLNHIAR